MANDSKLEELRGQLGEHGMAADAREIAGEPTRTCFCAGGCAGAGGFERGRFAYVPACTCWCHRG